MKKWIQVRCDKSLKDIVDKKATLNGLNESEYIRRLIQNDDTDDLMVSKQNVLNCFQSLFEAIPQYLHSRISAEKIKKQNEILGELDLKEAKQQELVNKIYERLKTLPSDKDVQLEFQRLKQLFVDDKKVMQCIDKLFKMWKDNKYVGQETLNLEK